MVKRSWKSLLTGLALAGGMAFGNAASAFDGGCTPGCGDNCACCEQIFADAGQKLTDQLASMSCCGCSETASCCAPSSVCDDGCCDPLADLCGEGCGDGCGEGCSLFGDSGSGIEFGGWTQFGYQTGPDGAFSGNGTFNNVNLGPGAGLGNSNEWNNFNLNQQGLFVGKTADGSKGLDWGFRAEMIYGVDGNEAQSFGNNAGKFDFHPDWNHGIYEWGMPQLYAEAAMGDLSVKVGHFYTPVGYEVIPSAGNFFLSRQLTFYNSEPFTHTGFLASYAAGDNLTILAGWSFGMDTGFDQLNGGSSVLGGFTYTIDESTSFTYSMTAGNLGWRGDGAINSFVLSRNWNDNFQTIHQFDVMGTNGSTLGYDFASAALPIADNSTGLINYALYTISDKLKAGARAEWYKADGTSYYTYTYGVNIIPMENLVIRPEVRHLVSPGAASAAAPGHDDLFNSTVFGIDAIITY